MTVPGSDRDPRPRSAAPAPETPLRPARGGEPGGLDQLVGLAYELLDAHRDTEELAADLASDQNWRAHVAYLRALQRAGREALARASLQEQA
jgi:hypothetical protein